MEPFFMAMFAIPVGIFVLAAFFGLFEGTWGN